jgi:hypothetical protein
MQLARIVTCLVAFVAPALVESCDPNDEVCHGCTAICSHYTDDTKVVTDPHCHQRCQADVYNCIEGTLPHEEAAGERTKCIQEKLLERIREDGDLVTKIVYDTPPDFEEFDQLYQEDGRIDSRDMAVAADILDGGAAPDGTQIPTAKVNVIMEVYREADVDGDGVVTEGEFNAYAKGNEHLGHHVEDLHPTPKQKPIEKAAEDLAPESLIQDVALMQSVFRSRKTQKRKFHRKMEVHKKPKQTGLAYFQHLLRLGLRVHRAETQKQHPIGILALKMVNSKTAASKANKKQ